ncbi:PhoX family protein [Taklimakanibacter deserti]|uniref:PhoX family protein n=1 Tax=Taklimakanibacter deserti TaxID=2267839 RepID=UPI000E649376
MTRHDPDHIRSKTTSPNFRSVLAERLSRRDLLRSGAAAAAASAIVPGFAGSIFGGEAMAGGTQSSLTFTELKRVYDKTHHVAPGFTAEVLLRWGDKLTADAAEFDPAQQSATSQARQFGYNNDFVGYLPLPFGSNSSEHGLLCVNHEYPSPHIMFPTLIVKDEGVGKVLSQDQVEVLKAAIGHTVAEIEKKDGKWRLVANSPLNRRITAETEMVIAGPAAGHAQLKTSADPTGTKVKGTMANCGGGYTPWGTILTCEEFAYEFFGGDAAKTANKEIAERVGYEPGDVYGFARFNDRFDVEKEPNEMNRFQWVVEIDPYEADSVPVKRTALGRMGHEGATVVVNKDGRVAVYMGDDDHQEYLYRFVSAKPFNASDRKANIGLLDEGELAVAKFEADGTLNWLPLVHGQGPLTPENGFADQGEVLIKTQLAADKLGATGMDRPEDFETNPVSGRVYAVLTKSNKRKPENLNAANPRPENKWGHIVELIPPGEGKEADHTAAQYKWDILMLCGDPSKPETGAKFHPDTTADGFFMTPDNIAFDPKGRMFVATDGMNDFDLADGIFAVDTDGPARALPKALFCCPTDAEATGPAFTPDGATMFVSVQHPAEGSPTIEAPTTRWPDFDDKIPPRPSVVVITRDGGGPIGG